MEIEGTGEVRGEDEMAGYRDDPSGSVKGPFTNRY
jgi:hypothetical protein